MTKVILDVETNSSKYTPEGIQVNTDELDQIIKGCAKVFDQV